MNTRRQVLQGLIFSLGGAAALSAFEAESGTPKPITSGFYGPGPLELVTFLADAIIPRTDTPGALDAGVPAYMDHLFLTWASEATQAEHRSQLGKLMVYLERYGGFNPKDKAQSLEALTELDAAAFGSDWNTLGGYRAIKSLIATVYYLSEPGATQELQYEPVPGHWIASAPLAEIGRTWAL